MRCSYESINCFYRPAFFSSHYGFVLFSDSKKSVRINVYRRFITFWCRRIGFCAHHNWRRVHQSVELRASFFFGKFLMVGFVSVMKARRSESKVNLRQFRLIAGIRSEAQCKKIYAIELRRFYDKLHASDRRSNKSGDWRFPRKRCLHITASGCKVTTASAIA